MVYTFIFVKIQKITNEILFVTKIMYLCDKMMRVDNTLSFRN